MEYTAQTIEIKDISDDQNPTKKIKKIVKDYDHNLTDLASNADYKGDSDSATFEFDSTVQAECIEIDASNQKHQILEVKSIRKPTTSSTPTVKNSRGSKRLITVLDPNVPAFVCTEHNENINYDCRYCRIACGFKKKNSQKIVQNDEISSTGKVTVAIPKRDINSQVKSTNDGIYSENNAEAINGNIPSIGNVNVPFTHKQSKFTLKFHPEWLKLAEFKDWLIETKISEDFSSAQCKYCGNVLVNNPTNLVRHALSKKHLKNESEMLHHLNEQGKTSVNIKPDEKDSKEDIFGRYIASELKRIKNKKTYEEVKWKILQALQSASEKETEEVESPATTQS